MMITLLLDRPSVSAYPPTGFVEVTLGDEVKMSCKGEGVPHPMITWSRKVIFSENLQKSIITESTHISER